LKRNYGYVAETDRHTSTVFILVAVMQIQGINISLSSVRKKLYWATRFLFRGKNVPFSR
jgi:hypothetical protein